MSIAAPLRPLRLPLALVLCLGSLLGAPLRAQESDKPAFSAADQRKLTELIGRFFEARRSDSSDLKVREELDKLVESFESKRGETRRFLAQTADLEQALRASRSFRDQGVVKGRIRTAEFTENNFGGLLRYAVHVPKNYSARNAYPLVLSIPDTGEKLEDHLRDTWADAATRDAVILVAIEMPPDVEMWNTMGSRDNGGGIARTLHVMRVVTSELHVNPEAVFLAGKGRGVEAALTVGSIFPDRFAGVLGRSGDAGSIPMDNFLNLPVYFSGAGENASAFAKAAEAAGRSNVTLSPDGTEGNAFEWLQSRVRQANPTEVLLVPRSETGSKAYWLELRGFHPDEGPRVHGKIDRATNTITVDAQRVSQVRLYYNDRLLDLSKPIRVVINGVEQEHRLSRSMLTMLNVAWLTGDFGRVYTAERIYDVPIAASGS